ncbi:MAG: LysM peptidoglycan-binding domain-containing protein [Bacteroidota bacterium]
MITQLRRWITRSATPLLAAGLIWGGTTVQAQPQEAAIERVSIVPQFFNQAHEIPTKWGPTTQLDTTRAQQVTLDDLQKEIMTRIADVYRMQVLAIDAQVKNDPLSAESYINNAISELQGMTDDYPEVQSDRRFKELYRSVMAEYRGFYGIKDPSKQVEGEIFAIQKELFSEDDDWMDENYVLPENVNLNKTKVPLLQNRQVSRHLMYYAFKRPEVMQAWLDRSEQYFPMMRKIFKEEGLPLELVHLSMIESGLVPTARSWAAASGMWQFIKATGSVYGLEVNWWVDERRDPEKATRAAARHLKDLYNIWGDWHLALANYNVSPRRLKWAIRQAGGEKDYWSAYSYLPRETRGYVPGFIAATIISMNPEEFGFEEPTYGEDPYKYDVVRVDGLIELNTLAEFAGISTQELKKYNPELLRWATPPGGEYPLKIPVDSKESFIAAYEKMPEKERQTNIAMHTVRSGESLGYIARKYGTSVRGLYEVNENLSEIIHPGDRIVVPLPAGSSTSLAVNKPSHQPRGNVSSRSSSRDRRQAPANSTQLTYTVKRGDTIGHIAEWYDVAAWKVRAWNGTGNRIYPGAKLTIYVPNNKVSLYRRVNDLSFAEKQNIESRQRSGESLASINLASNDNNGSVVKYRVRRNDTLIDIANSFNTTVGEIQRLNNLRSTRIYVGQTLSIRRAK